MVMSGQIFISYRREDSAPWARRIYKEFMRVRLLSRRQMFMDVDSLEPGIDFVEARSGAAAAARRAALALRP
jgi:hypothetical protein